MQTPMVKQLPLHPLGLVLGEKDAGVWFSSKADAGGWDLPQEPFWCVEAMLSSYFNI